MPYIPIEKIINEKNEKDDKNKKNNENNKPKNFMLDSINMYQWDYPVEKIIKKYKLKEKNNYE